MSADAIDIGEVVQVLRLARAGWPDGSTGTTDGLSAAAWHGFLAAEGTEGAVGLTSKGRDFLDKWGVAYPEYR